MTPTSSPAVSIPASGAFIHPFTSIADARRDGPRVIASGSGVRLRDAAGREYIDAMAGLWCVNIGYGRERIAEAMADQARQLGYYHSFMGYANEPSLALAERLAALAPGGLRRVFFGCSGSDANDTNIKLLWLYNNLLGRPGRKKIIARREAYHGVTIAAASMGGLQRLHARFDLPYGDRFLHVDCPNAYWNAAPGESGLHYSARLAAELEALIEREGADTIAAFIAEPVMGAAGVVPPPEGYFEAIVPILRRHGVLFIADEVVCGFGRLGTWFGSDRFNLRPDIVTLAKGLTSGYAPLSASLVSEEIWGVLESASPETGPLQHGYTYSGHPVAAACALANLDILQEERLVERGAVIGAYLQERLAAFADHPLVGEKRGIGMIAALELVADKAAKTPFDLKLGAGRRLYEKMLAAGVIVRPINNSIAFSPPLVLTEGDADQIAEAAGRSLDELAGELRAEGVWRG